MANSYLPQEILIEIFSRLPAKSVGRCSCLDKTWRTLLSAPQFIKSYLLHKPYQQNLFILDPSGSVHSAAAVEGAVSRKLELQHKFKQIEGSCDGLDLFLDDEYRKVLVNPVILQSKEITNLPTSFPDIECFSVYRLGYDRISDDFKIVALTVWDTDNEGSPNWAVPSVDVYSVRNCVWKRVDSSPYDHPIDHISGGAFVNGAMHWIVRSREEGFRPVIAAFDLAREVFDESPFPSDVDLEGLVHYYLDVLGGCLCVVDNRINKCVFWVMKEYGVGKSWRKFSIEEECEYEIIVWPLCFVGDDEEVILLTDYDSLIVYNVKEKAFRAWLLMDFRHRCRAEVPSSRASSGRLHLKRACRA